MRSRRSWSVIGLIGAAFTVISAGIGLIQIRYSVQALIYNNLKNISNQTDLLTTNSRLEAQSNLYLPLGMFLVTLGLAMLFSTVLRIGWSFMTIENEPSKSKKTHRIAGFVAWLRWLGWTDTVPVVVAVAFMAIAYVSLPQVNKAVSNVVKAVFGHPAFPIGFSVMAVIFWVFLDAALKERPQREPLLR